MEFTSIYGTWNYKNLSSFLSMVILQESIRVMVKLWRLVNLLKTRVMTGLAYLGQCQEYPLYALLDFWKFDLLCILSMMNIFSIIWSLCAVQSCQKKHVPIWPLWCQKFLPFCTSVPLFHPHTNLWWLFFFSFHFFHFFKYCGFIFLCQRLFFKGKVSDTVV